MDLSIGGIQIVLDVNKFEGVGALTLLHLVQPARNFGSLGGELFYSYGRMVEV